jgi:hypothetical protein
MIMLATVRSEGVRRLNPSVYFKPIAHPTGDEQVKPSHGQLLQSVFRRKPAPDLIRGGHRFAV